MVVAFGRLWAAAARMNSHGVPRCGLVLGSDSERVEAIASAGTGTKLISCGVQRTARYRGKFTPSVRSWARVIS